MSRGSIVAAGLVLCGCAGNPPASGDRGEASAGVVAVTAPTATSSAPVAPPPSPPTAPAPASASAPPPGPCPEDMVDVGRACIDRYEAPNLAGESPLLMQSAEEGERWCRDHGKRLCTEDEWLRACEGPHHRPFPYGAKYVEGTCNDDKPWRQPTWRVLGRWPAEEAVAEVRRLDQSEKSGARSGCVSEEGVVDLTGNVSEWVVRTRDNPTNYSHVVKGCFWGKCFRPPHTPSCEYVNFAHPAGFRSYEMGFRCCRERAP